MSSKLHSISTSCNLNFTASQSHTPSTSRRFMFSCNSVSLCAVKMLHQGAAGAFSWSICCSQWLNHCVKVISISVVFFTLNALVFFKSWLFFAQLNCVQVTQVEVHSRALFFCNLLVTLHNGIAALKGP